MYSVQADYFTGQMPFQPHQPCQGIKAITEKQRMKMQRIQTQLGAYLRPGNIWLLQQFSDMFQFTAVTCTTAVFFIYISIVVFCSIIADTN